MVLFPVPTNETRSLFPKWLLLLIQLFQRSTFPTNVVHLRTNLILGQCLLQIKIHFSRSTKQSCCWWYYGYSGSIHRLFCTYLSSLAQNKTSVLAQTLNRRAHRPDFGHVHPWFVLIQSVESLLFNTNENQGQNQLLSFSFAHCSSAMPQKEKRSSEYAIVSMSSDFTALMAVELHHGWIWTKVLWTANMGHCTTACEITWLPTCCKADIQIFR